jgi:hypothetical protein
LNEPELIAPAKGRKKQDMDWIRFSPNSEDWVTWNFFQIPLRKHPRDWWAEISGTARKKNPNLDPVLQDLASPHISFGQSVPVPGEYERSSRERMKLSSSSALSLRAEKTDPAEGESEITLFSITAVS